VESLKKALDKSYYGRGGNRDGFSLSIDFVTDKLSTKPAQVSVRTGLGFQ